MSKISNPQELTNRIQRILRQASTGTPTRARLAEEIKQVAEDLEAGSKTASAASAEGFMDALDTMQNSLRDLKVTVKKVWDASDKLEPSDIAGYKRIIGKDRDNLLAKTKRYADELSDLIDAMMEDN